MPTNPWSVTGHVYPVQTDSRYAGADPHEYIATLSCVICHELVDEWDSAHETANGIQWLDKTDAQAALRQIAAEIAADPRAAQNWFTFEHDCWPPEPEIDRGSQGEGEDR